MQLCNVHHAILSFRSHKLFNNSDCTRTIVRWMKLYLRWSALSAHIRFRLRSVSADLVPWTASKAAIEINWKLAHWSEFPLSPSIKHTNLIKLMITYFVCCWKLLSQSQRRIINQSFWVKTWMQSNQSLYVKTFVKEMYIFYSYIANLNVVISFRLRRPR